MKTVLVTGGTVRLGKAIAERLRDDGWRVITSSHRADAGADLVADLAEPMGAAKLYAAALQALDGTPPDALVNNAALFTGDTDVIRTVGLEAPKRLTMMMAGREHGIGAVVNVLDASSAPSGGLDASRRAYYDAKAELRAFTVSSAMMFAASLRVNAVAPGPVMAPVGVHEKAGETLLDRRPTADDVASAVSYLLSAASTTGVILPVDAGEHLLSAR